MFTTITPAGLKATEYIGLHPEMQTRTLARLMIEEHPKLFTSIDQARSMIRSRKGRNGKVRFKTLQDRRFVLPPATPDNLLQLPPSDEVPWLPYVIPDNTQSILVLGDIHCPYHHVKSVEAALNHGKDIGVDCIVLNGDTMDCHALSKFVKDPDARDFPGEREVTVHMLMAIRNMFPNARIVYKEGNHEARHGMLMKTQASAYYGLKEMRLEVLLDLFNMGIDYVADKRPIVYRELTILHGHETGSTSGGVNPARTALLKTRTCVIVNHFHRKTGDMQRVLGGPWLQAWSGGCLCELNPQYMPINDWVRGFIHITGGDNWKVDNLAILDGVVV